MRGCHLLDCQPDISYIDRDNVGKQETLDNFAEDTGGHYIKCCVRKWSERGARRIMKCMLLGPRVPHYGWICRKREGGGCARFSCFGVNARAFNPFDEHEEVIML